MTFRFNGQVYLFGFKVVDHGPEGTASAQLKARATRTSTGAWAFRSA